MSARRDELFELVDALLCADGPVHSLVELSLAGEYRRGRGSLYAALNRGRIDIEALKTSLAAFGEGVYRSRSQDLGVEAWWRTTFRPEFAPVDVLVILPRDGCLDAATTQVTSVAAGCTPYPFNAPSLWRA